jgi:hypothetical protein
MKISDTEVSDLLKSEKPWNVARRAFSNATARISATEDLTVLELRRLEFEAVADIARALGMLLAPEGDPEAPRDPSGPSPWSLCEGCPPVGYPTDKTRCAPCPRRTAGELPGPAPGTSGPDAAGSAP